MAEPRPLETELERAADPAGVPSQPTGLPQDKANGLAFIMAGGEPSLDADYAQALEVAQSKKGLGFVMDGAQPSDDPNFGSFELFGLNVPYPKTLAGAGQAAMTAGKDIVGGITGDAASIAGAPLKGVRAAVRLYEEATQPLVDWLDSNVANLKVDGLAKPSEMVPNPFGIADREAQTVTGGLLSGITQFVTGFGLAGNLVKGAGFGATVAKGAIADFAFFDGVEKNFADLIRLFPDAQQNEILAYLAAKEDDAPLENRLRNTLAGVVPNVALEPLLYGLRALKEARKVKALTGEPTYEAAQRVIEQTDAVKPAGAKVEELLGKPDEPLVKPPEDAFEKFAVETGVPDQFAATGMVRTATEGEIGQPAAAASTAPRTITAADIRSRFTDADGAFDMQAAAKEIRTDLEAAATRGDEIFATMDGQRTKLTFDGKEFRDQNGNAVGMVSPVAGKGANDGFEIVPKQQATGTPDPAPGTTRFYQGYWGENPRDLKGVSGLVFTTNKENVDVYQKSVSGKVWYVDVPTDKIKEFRDLDSSMKNLGAEDLAIDRTSGKPAERFKIPEEIAAQRKEYVAGAKIEAPAEGTTRVYIAGPPGYTGAPFINFARINAPEDIKSILGQMASSFKDEIGAKARGVRTNAQTMAAAGDENAWKILEGQRKIPIPNAEEQLALRQLWASSGQKLLEVAKAAQSGGAEEAFAFRRMLAIHNLVQQEVLAIRTETARALQQWRIPAGAEGDRLRSLDDVLRQNGGTDLAQKQAAAVMDLASRPDGVARVDKFVQRSVYAKSADALIEAWKAGLLWSPTTHIVNSLSNSMVLPLSVIERAAAGRIAEFTNPVEGIKLGEATMMAWGQAKHLREAFRMAAETLRTGEQQFGGVQSEASPLPRVSSEYFGVEPKSLVGRGLDMLGTFYVQPVFRLLGASDAFFKELHYGAELNAAALRQASEEVMRGKITREQLAERVQQIIDNPSEDLRLGARDFAEYNTFTNDPGPMVKSLMKVRDSDNPTLRLVGNVVLPFVQTPANIFRFTFERTPIAPLIAKFHHDVAAGGARRDLAIARLGLGTAVMAVAYDLAMDGFIVGSLPPGDTNDSKNIGKAQLYDRAGVKRNSIRVVEGTDAEGKPIYRFYPINRFDPVASQFLLAAELANIVRANNGSVGIEWEEAWAAATFNATNIFLDKSYMKSAAELIDAIHNPRQYGERWWTALGSSIVPSAVAYAARQLDPIQRQTWDLMSSLQAKIPGLRDNLPPSLDFWGRERTLQSGLGPVYDALVPSASKSTEQLEPIDRELDRLNFYPTTPTSIHVPGVSEQPRARGQRMTPAEREALGSIPIPLRNAPDIKNAFITLQSATPARELLPAAQTDTGPNSAAARRILQASGSYTLKEALNGMVGGDPSTEQIIAAVHPNYRGRPYQDLGDEERVDVIQQIIRAYRGAARQRILSDQAFKPKLQELRRSKPTRGQLAEPSPFSGID